MTRHPQRTEARRSLRIVTLGLVFLVGGFFAQGQAADAQQVRYTTALPGAERVTVPAPLAASPSTPGGTVTAGASRRQATVSVWLAVLPATDDRSSGFVHGLGPDVGAREIPAPSTRRTSDRAPPSPLD
jgi:hypothetical protein